MSHTAIVFIQLGGVLLALSLLSRVAGKLGQSAIPFYMTAGLLLGSGSLIPLTESREFLEIGAEIGVVILLLMIGLEYSPKELIKSLRQNKSTAFFDALFNATPGFIAGLLLGWGLTGAFILAGVTWITSSGVTVRLLRELGRLANRETPTIISVLVLEDLAMAFYLPVLSAVAVGASLMEGAISVAIAIGLVTSILSISYFYGKTISRIFSTNNIESLIIGVAGLSILIAGLAAEVKVSSAVGAFLVGISLSGKVAAEAANRLRPLRDFFGAIFFVYFGIQTNPLEIPQAFLPALVLAIVTIATKVLTGYLAAKRNGIGIPGRWRTGLALTPRGEFSIIIAGLAISAGLNPAIVPFAATYMLMTVIAGPLLARLTDVQYFKDLLGNAQLRANAKSAQKKANDSAA
jgi:CPA2 family monovalent cation:H+ antiporter-2